MNQNVRRILSTICCSVGADQNIFSKILAVFQIVGPMADNVDGIFGGYSPEPDPDYIKTPRQGLSSLGTHDITVWVCVFCPLFCSCVCSMISSVLRWEFFGVSRSESPFCWWLYKLGYKMFRLRQRFHPASGERIRHSVRVPGNRCVTQYHVRWPLDWDRMH